MPTAKKLPSGSWRCRVFSHYDIMPDGTKKPVYESFTVKDPSKRGKKECERLAAEWSVSHEDRSVAAMTVQECIRKYIDIKETNLSPSTIAGYESLYRNAFEEIRLYSIGDLTPPIVQTWINCLSSRVGPKSARNANALFGASLKFFGGPTFNVTLPPPQEFIPHVPCDEEIRQLMDYIVNSLTDGSRKDTRPRRELLVAVMLAAFGSLRRGEICALTGTDVDPEGNHVHVSKDVVQDKHGVWVTKPVPKTSTSNRTVDLPPFVIEKVLELANADRPSARIIQASPDMISDRFARAVRFSGAKVSFRFHDLRHYYVSIAHALGIPDAYIMEMGGWKTETVMKRVYRATLADRAKMERDKLTGHFDRLHGAG